MLVVASFCLGLLLMSTAIHFEMLRALSTVLPSMRMPARAKLILVILGTFCAHAAEILLYALVIYVLVRYLHLGTLGEVHRFSLSAAVYFSAETYTSLGYGDVVPSGDLRLLAGVEALNGLLLIGWSASYTYISMERFWSGDRSKDGQDRF